VDNEVRRSPRLERNNKGSKPFGCSEKKCLACSTSPPTLSTKAIKKLGLQFCEMDPKSPEDKVLKKKKKKTSLVVKKQEKKIPGDQKKDDDGNGPGMPEREDGAEES